MRIANITEAKAQLSRLVDETLAGQEVVFARASTEDGRRLVFVSAASAWEIAIKARLGEARGALRRHRHAAARPVLPLDVTSEHALAVRNLPDLHRDAFDRMLVAQAKAERLAIVTHEVAIRRHEVTTIAATW
jgi:PIN domain nuclease of toxin-antitoxin system